MNPSSNPHHLVLGQLKDFLTGMDLTDTHDERYRQKIVRKLVMDNQFDKKDIQSNIELEICAGKKKARIRVDYLIHRGNHVVALIQYGPGSLVTRRLSTLALSRIIKPYQIPLAVITNGEDAEIIHGDTGKVMAHGLDNMPDKEMVQNMWSSFSFKPVSSIVFDQASRIVFAFEVEGACPCDSDVCVME